MDILNKIDDYLNEKKKEIDWDDVWEALMDAAKDIFDDVDEKKLKGVFNAISDKKPKDTEDAIQIGIDMLRSEN